MNFKTKEEVYKVEYKTLHGNLICTSYALEGAYPHEIVWHDGIAKTPEGTKRRLTRRKYLKYYREAMSGSSPKSHGVVATDMFLDMVSHCESVSIKV